MNVWPRPEIFRIAWCSMTATIHSVHNPRIKQALRLRDRRGRQQQARIIVDGWRETCRALGGNVQPLELFVCEPLLTPQQFQQLAVQSAARGVEPTLVTCEVFGKLAFGDRGEGVVLVAAQPRTDLEQLPFPAEAVVCVLEHVEKPGNLGAVVRTADAAGISAVIVANAATDLYNPNAIRASLARSFMSRSRPPGARNARLAGATECQHLRSPCRRRDTVLASGLARTLCNRLGERIPRTVGYLARKRNPVRQTADARDRR